MQEHDLDSCSSVVAVIAGTPLTELPKDLFIPPDALRVLLDSFSGPLDLLYYLIKQQNIDILNIPMALITRQYMEYIRLMESHRLELAADYLVMAAMLIEIKSRMLLPHRLDGQEEETDEDPRLVLVRKLQAYEQIKNASIKLDTLPRQERDFFRLRALVFGMPVFKTYPDVALNTLPQMMAGLLQQQDHKQSHHIQRELLSVRERMSMILNRLHAEKYIVFNHLLVNNEGKIGVSVTLLALLELARQSMLRIHQTDPFSLIQIMAIDHDY